jgi:NitT/TauT family transport system substrate-binding protein
MKTLSATLLLLAAVLPLSLAAEEKTHLRVGHLPVTGHAKFFVAQEEGFFAQEGLEVELVEFANSADGLAALRAGKLDVGAFGTTAPLVHVSKGADIRIIGGVMGEDASLITTPELAPSIKSVADLKGKKIATVRLATGDAVLRGALEQAGLDWKTGVQIFELKNPPAVQEAVKSGQVDVGVTWGPFDLRAEQAGLKVVIRSRSLSPGHPCCRLTVNTKELQDRPTVWVHFLRAFLRAELFAQGNHEKTIDDISKYLKLDRGLIKSAYYEGYLDQSSDPNLTGVVLFWKTMLKSGFVESTLDITPFVDVAPYRTALTQLAAEQPSEAFWKQALKTFAERDAVKVSELTAPDSAVQIVSAEALHHCH